MGKQQGNDEFSVKAKALVEKMRGYDFSDDEIKDALRKLKKKYLSEPTPSSSSEEPTPSSEAITTSESVGTPSFDISKLGYSWGESTLTPDKELKGDVVQYSQSTTSDIVDVPEKPKSLTPKEDELRGKMDANDALILEIDESLDRTRNRDLGDNNAQIQRRKREEERQGLLKEQESLSSEYLQPTLEKALSGIISEDGSVDESFLTQNVYGFTTPDLDKVRGVVDDNLAFDRFKPKLQKEITSAIDFAVNAPKEKVTSKADEIFKKETGQSFDEAMKSDASKAFNDKYSKEILQANASVKAYASQVGSNYSKEIKAREASVTGQLDVLSKDYEEAVAQIRGMAEGATDQKEIDKLNSELERVNKEYNATAFKLSEEYQDEANELMSRANRDIQDRVEEVNGQVRNLTDKFAQEYGAPKEVVQKYQEAMSKAAAEVYAGSIYGKKGVINLLEDRSPLSNRVITSMLSSFGGALQGMANGVGYEAEWAQDMQQYFQPSIDPIKGFKNITLDKLQESSGNLLGSMIPSLTASIGTAVVTKNAPMAVRIAATGLAGWSSETLDLSGRAYRTALEKSGSEEVARSAASETIDSQLLLMPTYALDALPFVGAFKGIRNPILRVGTGGVVEYVQEFIQEYPQNLAEKAISETGRYNTMWDNISKESMQETAANLLPVAFLGVGGAISQDTSVKDGKDYILNIIDKGGKESAMLVAASLYNDGKIDKDTYESLGEFIDSVDDTNSLDYNKVLEELKDVATAAIEETDPVKKSILKEKEKELEAKAESILTGVLEESTEGIGYNNPKNTRFNEKLSGETETKETPVKEDTGKYTAQPTEELEQRMSELENSKDKKERDEFNEIEKELENREWGSVINAPLSEVESTVDELVEKEKSMPNGFGSFIEKADATETKEVAKKYSGEVSKADAKKDFDKAFNGSPSTWYADALKLKESVRVFLEQGGTFKELLQGQATEYTKDGFTEEEAASVIGRKLEDIKRQTDKSQQESQVKPDVSTTEVNDVVTPEILEQGKKEVTDVTKGTFSTANPVKIFKGIGGKKDLQGFRINAHKGAKGVFSSVDSELAATYGRDEGVAEVVIPKGTSIEVVEVDGTGMGMSDYRAAEVKAINNSDAQIVKLITIDGVMKAGEKRQQQYVIKDDSLIEGLKKEESPTSTKDDSGPSVKKPKTTTQKAIDKTVEGKATTEKKTTISDKAGLYKQIRDFARGVREGRKAQKEVAAEVNKMISENLQLLGDITPAQAKALTRRAAKIDFGNEKSVDAFIDYAAKVERSTEEKMYKSTVKRILDITKSSKMRKRSPSGVVKGKVENFARMVAEAVNSALRNDDTDEVARKIIFFQEEMFSGSKIKESDIARLEGLIIAQKALEGDLDSAEQALSEIEALIKGGRASLKEFITKRAEEYKQLKKDGLVFVTGGRGLLSQEERKKLKNKLDRSFFAKIQSIAGGFMDAQEGFRTLLDKISKDKGREENGYGSGMDKIAYIPIAEGRNTKLKLNREGLTLIRDKFKSIFGKNNVKVGVQNNKPQLVGEFTDNNGEKKRLIFSQNQAYPLYQYMKDPNNVKTFREMGWTDEMMDAVSDFVTPKVKEWADWQMDEFYPMYYDKVNKVYKDMNYMDLPKQDFYVPIIRDATNIKAKEADVSAQKLSNPTVTYPSLKARQNSKIPFSEGSDGDATLLNYMEGMNQYIAFAKPVKQLNVIFKDPKIRQGVRENSGDAALSYIDDFLERLATDSAARDKTSIIFDKIRGNIVTASLALAPTVLIKQLSSFPAYAVDIPTMEFIKGMGAFALNPARAIRLLMESEYMKDRYATGFDRDMVVAMAKDYNQKITGRSTFKDKMMFLIKWGDKGAIVMGGYSVYNYYYNKLIKEGKSKVEAKKKALFEFEEATKLSQQDSSMEGMSSIQTGGAINRFLTMYMTSPIAYMRQERKAVRDFIAGNNRKRAVKRFVMYHFVLPIFFQYIANGLPALLTEWDDEDEGDLFRAALFGSTNGIFVVGDVMSYVADYYQKKPWARGGLNLSPASSPVEGITKATMKLIKEWERDKGKFDDDLIEAIIDLSVKTDVALGFPAERLKNYYENWKMVLEDADKFTWGEKAALVAGYSKYTVGEGSAKKNTNKGTKKYFEKGD